ncbi:MAG: hypothetical protein LBL74_05250 [Bacteroidales bacterium]|nr:hypothetical protein [Bacteroidales bacterium]
MQRYNYFIYLKHRLCVPHRHFIILKGCFVRTKGCFRKMKRCFIFTKGCFIFA